MAEPVGLAASVITIAALFKTCLDAFELIQAGRRQEQDFVKLEVQLKIEKCRLYNWGEAMELTEPVGEQGRPLDSFQFSDLIKQCLECIIELFDNANKIRDDYGCEKCLPDFFIEAGGSNVIRHLTACFDGFRVSNHHGTDSAQRKKCSTNLLRKAKWVIKDKKRFRGFISEVKELIDGLVEITRSISSEQRQEQSLRKRISKTTNCETLNMISEVCEADYRSLSDAASDRAEALSLPDAKRNEIMIWSANVPEAAPPGITEPAQITDILEHVENFTLTELRQAFLEFVQSGITIAQMPQSVNARELVESEQIKTRKRSSSLIAYPEDPPAKRLAISCGINDDNSDDHDIWTDKALGINAKVHFRPQTTTATSTVDFEKHFVPCDQLQHDLEAMGHQVTEPSSLSSRYGSDDMDSWSLLNFQTPASSLGNLTWFNEELRCTRCNNPTSLHNASLESLAPRPLASRSSHRSILNQTNDSTSISATWHIPISTRHHERMWRWSTYCFLACIVRFRGDNYASEAILAEATAEFERAVVNQDALLLTTVQVVATILQTHDQGEIAQSILEANYQICERLLPPNDPVRAVVGFWTSVSTANEVSASEFKSETMRSAEERFSDVLGPRHLYTIAAKYSHGWMLKYEGRAREAEAVLYAAYTTSCSVLGHLHVQTICSLAAMAGAKLLQGRFQEARLNFYQVAADAALTLGKRHPYTLEAKRRLAMLILGNEETEGINIPCAKVEQLYWEVLVGRTKTLGRRHEYTQATRWDYEDICNSRGVWAEREGEVKVLFEEDAAPLRT